ncbi:MAG TPA: acyl-ACP thioesterase domain-containing protein [Candidatus Limnocylindrales bacterium]
MNGNDGDGPGEERPGGPVFVPCLTVPYRLRFDECGPDGIARTSALLRYAQDVAWIHSERLGFGREWYAARGLAWVVRAAELAILVPIPLGTTLVVATAVTGFRRVWARRRTEVRLEDGTHAAWGHSDWVIIDHRGMPGRVPPEFTARFGVMPGTFEPVRVTLPPSPADAVVLRTSVRSQDLDPMGHVNNAAYLDYLEEALLAAGEPGRRLLAAVPRRVRLEYAAAAAPGAALTGTAWPEGDAADDRWAWRLTDDGGRDIARGQVIGA